MSGKIIINRNRGRFLGPILFLILALGFLPSAVHAARGGLAGPGDEEDFNPASDSEGEGNQCLNRAGQDFNEILDVSEQFITRSPACRTVNSGEFYIPFSIWITNTAEGFPEEGWPVVYPDDYDPALPDPMADFLSKLSIRVTLDNFKVYLFRGEDVAKLTTLSTIDPAGVPPDAQAAALIPKLYPARIGSHVMRIEWVLSARHCDGLGTVAASCLDAGVNLADPTSDARNFSVVPGAVQAQ